MLAKALEIRDRGTFIAALAVDMNPHTAPGNLDLSLKHHAAQHWLLSRCGYPCDGRPNILITHLAANGTPAWNDPYGWKDGARTYPVAHNYIIEHRDELKDGDVIDVEFILGQTKEPKRSERETVPL